MSAIPSLRDISLNPRPSRSVSFPKRKMRATPKRQTNFFPHGIAFDRKRIDKSGTAKNKKNIGNITSENVSNSNIGISIRSGMKMLTISSGADVPNATTVSPTTRGEIQRVSAKEDAPRTRDSPPIIRITSPTKRRRKGEKLHSRKKKLPLFFFVL